MTEITAGGSQEWGTPPEFLDAVERLFGRKMDFDLAATRRNTIIKKRFFAQKDDALSRSWKGIGKNLWLNPPFEYAGEPQKPSGRCFAQKCWEEAAHLNRDQKIFLLVRASVSCEWYDHYVHGSADVYAIRPRLKFVGAKDPYNSDLTLAVFYPGRRQSRFFTWKWNDPAAEPRKAY